MFEDIQKHRQAVAKNIEKSLQIGYTEGEDFEKAHNVGDIHPNGKWVWAQLPSGKFDWRVRKQGGSSAPAAPSAMGSTQITPKSSIVDAKTFEDVLAAYQKGGINAVQTFDAKAYDLFEYEKQKKMALSVDESGRSFGAQLVKTNIKETQQKIDDTKKNHPGAHATMVKLNQQMAKFNAQLKAIEDAEKEVKSVSKSDSKPSAFVNKTVQLIKEKKKNWGGWDENKEKIAESVLTKNEALAKKFMSMTFPAASASAGPLFPSEKSIVISGADEIIFSAYKTIDTTSRNPAFRGSTDYNYNIYHKLGNTRTMLSTASYSSASRWTTSSEEKNDCKIEALMRYFHI